jgi:hypothetical protein
MTRKELNIALAEKETNLRQWAIDHDYKPRTVQQVVQRYIGADREPRGRLTYKILRELSRTLGKEILPGILDNEL